MAGKPADARDAHIGALIESRRVRVGLSRDSLAGALGVSVSQLGKYIKGLNRLSATDLDTAGRLLGVPVGYFFEGMPGREPPAAGLSDRPQAGIEGLSVWTGFAAAVAQAADTHLDGESRLVLGSIVRAVDRALAEPGSFDKENVSGSSG
ncbi:hypothetical protein OPKNFCMD_0936 [Methylobacterium crusticola]|uniref:HTH cro/C1-type domain-containing protein n=1 Tax=Methylobacterium crusticola TaxID=1697972 RepID=A0ABQ4QTX2_9HYPH|nr:helix-turn-helix transcriptional regulator [Methylobacterium crusticola]GJD48220.1 hypothetical protein OPKNFCMD_0936 [Methylobacterium crusticola]